MITCRKVWHRVTRHAHHVAHPIRHAHHAHHARHAWHATTVCKYVGAGALALGLGTGAGALIGGSMPAFAWPAGLAPGAYVAPGYLPGGGGFDRVRTGRIVNPKGPQNVPEPASIAVFAVGAVAAFAVRRKK